MEWTACLKASIEYMEKHLLEDIGAEQVADEVHISSFYLQKGFKIMTGYSIGEYIRCRRLYLAALDVLATDEKIIDLAYKYGYDTPESFTRAFSRFHGISPVQIKKNASKIKVFLPLKIKVIIQGGNDMDYVVEQMKGFRVIGFERIFSFENSYKEIPKFWDEICERYMGPLFNSDGPKNEIEQAVCDNMIGEFGVCIEDCPEQGKFRYLIAGPYNGGKVPEGMKVFDFPDMTWAKFRCVGPMPGALQSVNTKIFNEWLPGNLKYKIAMGANIEWYSQGDTSSADYESGIWIPVVKKD